MPRLVKGSPEAIAWGLKMKKAKEAKPKTEKVKKVRTEEQVAKDIAKMVMVRMAGCEKMGMRPPKREKVTKL